MSFQEKYYKYKNKYLKIKGNQLGGELTEEITDKYTISGFLLPLIDIPYKTSKLLFIDEETGKKIHIIKITLNEDKDKPVLFALAGMSHKSFVGTSTVILSKLNLLKEKFKEIYLAEYANFSEDQSKACKERDKIIETSKDVDEIYNPEAVMNNNIAEFLNNIILNNLKLKNVHLLGKCNGAWVVTLLLLKHKIYKGLYLAVPGIPYNVTILSKLDKERLKNINFVFGWVKQDGFKFTWGKSNEEQKRYHSTMEKIQKNKKINLKYKSKEYNNNNEEDEKIYHEIFPDMIDDIVNSIE